MNDKAQPETCTRFDQEFIRCAEEAAPRVELERAHGLSYRPAPGCIQKMAAKLAAIETAALTGNTEECRRLAAEADTF